jgi:hypothetical protein
MDGINCHHHQSVGAFICVLTNLDLRVPYSAYKQIKNWFSNERQKNRIGESIPVETEDGDKVRLRTSALSACQDWSDSFFEEVVMIYNYRVQRNSRFRVSLRGPHDASDYDQ